MQRRERLDAEAQIMRVIIPHACPYTFEQILDEDWWPVRGDPPEPAG